MPEDNVALEKEQTPAEAPVVEQKTAAEMLAEFVAESDRLNVSKESVLEETDKRGAERLARERAVTERTETIDRLDVSGLLGSVAYGRGLQLEGKTQIGYESPQTILENHAKKVGMTPMEYRGNLVKFGYGWEWMADSVGREGRSVKDVLAEAKSRGTVGLLPEREREIRMRGESLKDAAIDNYIEKGEAIPDAFLKDSFVVSGTRNAIIGMDADEEGLADMFSGGEIDKILSREGEKGFVNAQVEAEMLTTMPAVARLITEYSGDAIGGDKYIEKRTGLLIQEYRRINEKEPTKDVIKAFTLQSANELATFKVAGMWHSPIFIRSDRLLANEKGTAGQLSWYDAFAPTLEIVGVDNKGNFVVRESTAVSHLFDKADAIQAGIVGGFKYGGLEGVKQGIAQNRNFLEASIETAADEDYGMFGMAVLGTVGLAGMVATPDLLFSAAGAPKTLKKAQDTASVLKGGTAASKAMEQMLEAYKANDPAEFARQSRVFAAKYKVASEQIDQLTVSLSPLMQKQNPDIGGPQGIALAKALPGKAGEQRVNIAPEIKKLESKLSTKPATERGKPQPQEGEKPKRPTTSEETPIVTPSLYDFERKLKIIEEERNILQTRGVDDSNFRGQLAKNTSRPGVELQKLLEDAGGSAAAVSHRKQLRQSLGDAMRDPDAWYKNQESLIKRHPGMEKTYAGTKADAIKAIDNQVSAGVISAKKGKNLKKQINSSAKARQQAYKNLRDIRDEARKLKKEMPNKEELLALLDRAEEAVMTQAETRAAATYVFYSSVMDNLNPYGKKMFGLGKKRTDLLKKSLADDLETYSKLSENALNFAKQAMDTFKVSRAEALNAAALLEARARNLSRQKGITVDKWWETRVKGIETKEDLQKIVDEATEGTPPKPGPGPEVEEVVDVVEETVEEAVEEVAEKEASEAIREAIEELGTLVEPLGQQTRFLGKAYKRTDQDAVGDLLFEYSRVKYLEDMEQFLENLSKAIRGNQDDVSATMRLGRSTDSAFVKANKKKIDGVVVLRNKIDRLLKDIQSNANKLTLEPTPPVKPIPSAEELMLPPAKPLPAPPKNMPKPNKAGFGRVTYIPSSFEKENMFLAPLGQEFQWFDRLAYDWRSYIDKSRPEADPGPIKDLRSGFLDQFVDLLDKSFEELASDLVSGGTANLLLNKDQKVYKAINAAGEEVLRKDFPTALEDVLKQHDDAVDFVTKKEFRQSKQGLSPQELYAHLVQFDARVNPNARLRDVAEWMSTYAKNAGCRAICRRILKSEGVHKKGTFYILNSRGTLTYKKAQEHIKNNTEARTPTTDLSEFIGLASGQKPDWNLIRGSGFDQTGLTEETIAHELLHSVTINLLYKGLNGEAGPEITAAAKALDDFTAEIADIAKKEKTRLEAITNRTPEENLRLNTANFMLKDFVIGPGNEVNRATEMVSYAMTDPEMQEFLRSIPIKEVLKPGEKPRTLLDKFVSLVGRLFSPGGRKLPPKEENAWHRALLLSEDLVTQVERVESFKIKTQELGFLYEDWVDTASFLENLLYDFSALTKRRPPAPRDKKLATELDDAALVLNNFYNKKNQIDTDIAFGLSIGAVDKVLRGKAFKAPTADQLSRVRKRLKEHEEKLVSLLDDAESVGKAAAKLSAEKLTTTEQLRKLERDKYDVDLQAIVTRDNSSDLQNLTRKQIVDIATDISEQRPQDFFQELIDRVGIPLNTKDEEFVLDLDDLFGVDYWKLNNLPETTSIAEAVKVHQDKLSSKIEDLQKLYENLVADDSARTGREIRSKIEAELNTFHELSKALNKEEPFALTKEVVEGVAAPPAAASAIREDTRVVDHADPFYSSLERASQNLPKRMQIDAIVPWMRKQRGVKAEEIEYTHIELFIEDMKAQGRTHLDSDEVMRHLQNNRVRVQAISTGDTEQALEASRTVDRAFDKIKDKLNEVGIVDDVEHFIYTDPADIARVCMKERLEPLSESLQSLGGELEITEMALQQPEFLKYSPWYDDSETPFQMTADSLNLDIGRAQKLSAFV
jgi:hypothetical protein